MNIIDIPFAKGDELIVDESAGTFTIEVKADLLGTPEDVKLQLGMKQVFAVLLAGVTNPIAKSALEILINLFA